MLILIKISELVLLNHKFYIKLSYDTLALGARIVILTILH